MKPPARTFTKTSAGFEAYYRGCGIVPDDEWGTFVDACRTALPTSFSLLDHPAASDALTHHRFVRLLERLGAAADGHATAAKVGGPGLAVASGAYVWTRLRVRGPSRGPTQGAVRLVLGIEAADEPVRCAPLLWFPRHLGWQLGAPRKELATHTMLAELRAFLEAHVATGRALRQEVGSMLPPLLLDVGAGQRILDLCAAPGSKTALLVNLLRRGGTNNALSGAAQVGDGGGGGGCVVANDADASRCRQMRLRLGPLRATCLLLTCHVAQSYPGDDCSFDRVLCDVPCSGDGTMRKNPTVWARWRPAGGRAMHALQLSILARGLELVRVGGLLLYSTCSFNPVENEAVIAAALIAAGGAVTLEPLPGGRLDGLRTAHGLSTWRVAHESTDDGAGIDAIDAADPPPGARRPRGGRRHLLPTMFAPPADVAADLHLHRCLRLLPHAQDTGGFFCARLRKTAELPPTGWLAPQAGKRTRSAPRRSSAIGSAIAEIAATRIVRGPSAPGVAAGRVSARPHPRFSKPLAAHTGARHLYTPVGRDSALGIELAEFYGLDENFRWDALVRAHQPTPRMHH